MKDNAKTPGREDAKEKSPMGECCGKRRESRFCPECGMELHVDDPIFGLLNHVATTVRGREMTAATVAGILKGYSSRSNVDERCKEQRADQLDRLNVVIKKWGEWERALRELIARGGT